MKRPRTASDMLDLIDAFLAAGTVESARLADVLTALRGPDSGILRVKQTTTMPIRCAALPQCMGASREDQMNLKMDFDTHGYREPDIESHGVHFSAHIVRAKAALEWMGRKVV